MGVITFLVRTGLRRRLASSLLLMVLLGLAAGAVLTAWAGARRTDSAYPRLLERTTGFDLTVSAGDRFERFVVDDVRDLSGIERIAGIHGFGAMPLLADGTPDFSSGSYFTAAADDLAYREMGAPIVLDGRLPDPTRADEVIVNETAVASGMELGGTVDACIFSFEEIGSFEEPEVITPEVLRAFVDQICAVHSLRVVGVGRFLDEVLMSEVNQGQAFMVATPAFAERPGKPASFQVALVDVEPGVDLVAFQAEVRDSVDPAAGVQIQSPALRAAVAARTATPYSRSLLLFAFAATVASLAVLGPAVRRSVTTSSADLIALGSAGVQPRQVRRAAAIRALIIASGSTALAVAVAVALSERFPLGPLREAEPDPGTKLDAVVAGVGCLVLLVASGALGASVAAHARRGGGPRRPVAIVEWLAAHGAPVSVVAGARAATDRSATSGVLAAPSGVVVAVIAVLASLGFQGGLARMLDTPSRFGFAWDAAYESYEEDLSADTAAHLRDSELVEAVSIGRRASVNLDGDAINLFAFDDLRGSVHPLVLDGRAPTAPLEIALGGQTMDRVGAELGDVVRLGAADQELEATVVGRTLLPLFTTGDDVSIGEGAWGTPALLDRLGVTDPRMALIDLVAGSSPEDLRTELIWADLVTEDSQNVLGPALTADLSGYDEVRWTPVLLAAVLGLLGFGVVAHHVVTSARERRRELAILRSLGCRRRTIRATIRWEGLVLALACLALGAPLGVAAGRAAWSSFARSLGVPPDPISAPLPILAVAAALLVGTALLTLVPGWRAAAVAPSQGLHDEGATWRR